MLRNTSGFWIVVALALSWSLISPSWGRANERVTEFNIPPQALESALLTFAEQANVQISVSTMTVVGIRTPGVIGRFTPSAALARLLTATGLRVSAIGDRTYAVSLSGDSNKTRTGSLNGSNEPRWADGYMRLPPRAEDANRLSEAPGQPANDEQKKGRHEGVMAEVIVTGTHIHGQEPVGGQLITIDRTAIDESGFSTVQDVVRSLPQNFGGGPSEDTTLGLEASTNAAYSTAFNLRGLGAGATLVLLNGRRFAPGGGEGTFTDVSSVPLSAIERIDVLPDGASAMYGSEAAGGVINLVLRNDYSGAESAARFGVATESSPDDFDFSQLLGTDWNNGHGLLSYEYYKRDNLPAPDRAASADSDLTPLGGDNFDDAFSNPGTIMVGTDTWAIPAGQDGRSLQPSDLVAGTINLANQNEGRDLLAQQERHTLFGTLQQEIAGGVTLFADLLGGRRESESKLRASSTTLVVPSTNPFYVNPTGGIDPILVSYSMIDDLGPLSFDAAVDTYNTTVGARFTLGSSWRVTAYGQYALEKVNQTADGLDFAALDAALADPDPATAFNPFGDGSFTNPATLAGLRARTEFDTRSRLWTANVTVDGPVVSVPGSQVQLALGSEHRNYGFNSELRAPSIGIPLLEKTFDRKVSAAFAEMLVPVVGDGNARPGLRRLDLSLAGRYENYSDYGDTVTPKIGLSWRLLQQLALRGTWSRSFKAPNLADLDESNNASLILSVSDPAAPSGSSPVLIWDGKNSNLTEEVARTWTVGAELNVASAPQLKLALTYFNIQFEDRIGAAQFTTTWLAEPRFAAIVTRNPTAEQRAEVCSRSQFIVVEGDDCLNSPIAAIVDLRTRNTAITNTSGLDAQATFEVETSLSRVSLDLNATYVFDFEQAELKSSPLVELIDTVNNPIDLRLRAGLNWTRGNVGVTAHVNYLDSYTDTVSQPNRRIGSWTTLDTQLSYQFDDTNQRLLGGSSIALSVQNAFDEDPPFVNNPAGIGYDPQNADLLGRIVSLQFRKNW